MEPYVCMHLCLHVCIYVCMYTERTLGDTIITSVYLLITVSRMFPQRPWATLVPTILSHEALDKLLTPVAGTSIGSGGIQCSPLERFLGCTYLKRHMLRIVTSDEAVRHVTIVTC